MLAQQPTARCLGQGGQVRSAFRAATRPPQRRAAARRRASPPGSEDKAAAPAAAAPPAALNEDMLAQLRQAQEEAARLKAELATLQEQRVSAGAGDEEGLGPRPRIDSTGSRETLWASGNRSSWLSEADVDFFTGGGATEAADTSGPTPEAQAAITKRLLIGGLATTGLAAFSLVPTKDLRLRPAKPLFFYVTQLLQAQAQLAECSGLIEGAQWDSLRLILPRIRGAPTNAEAALFDAIALLDRATAARAEPLAADFLEYLDAMDYNKYFDAMPTRVISGAQNAEFVKFSGSALKAAQAKLAAFLALLPPDALEAARTQVAGQSLE